MKITIIACCVITFSLIIVYWVTGLKDKVNFGGLASAEIPGSLSKRMSLVATEKQGTSLEQPPVLTPDNLTDQDKIVFRFSSRLETVAFTRTLLRTSLLFCLYNTKLEKSDILQFNLSSIYFQEMEPDSEIQWQEEFEHKGYLLRTGTTTRVKDTKINIVILNDYEKNFEIHLAAWEIDYSMDGCISILSEIARSVEISEHRQAFLEKAPERKIAKRQQPEINLEYIKKILNNNNIEPGRVGNMGDIHYFLSEDKTEFYLAAKIGSITVNEPWQEHPGFTITIPQDANYGIRVGGMPYREIGVYYQDATSGKWKLGDLQKLPRELEAGLPETFSEAITSGFTNKQTVHFFKFHFLKTEWHESRLEIESFLEEVRSLRKDFNEGRVIAISN